MEKPLPPEFPDPQVERFHLKRIFRLVLESLNLEKGIFYTLWHLLKDPGTALRTYLFTDRSKMYGPLKFLLLTMATYLFVLINFTEINDFAEGFKEGMSNDGEDIEKRQSSEYIIDVVQRFINIIILLSIPVGALISQLIFRRFRLWYTEHLVINAYLYSFLTVFLILATLILLPYPEAIPYLIIGVSWLYSIYFFRSLFKLSWWSSLWKSTLVLVLTQLIYAFCLVTFLIILIFIS